MRFNKKLQLLILLVCSSCGYTLQRSNNDVLTEMGIRKIYVAPVKNMSFKPGVENILYNELLKMVAASRRLEIVEKPEYADVVLNGRVDSAAYSPSATTSSDSVFGGVNNSPKTIQMIVATEYQAALNFSLSLMRNQGVGAPKKEIWGSSYARTKRFPSNIQKVEYGTTSQLISESNFDRVLKEMAHATMIEVQESMLSLF